MDTHEDWLTLLHGPGLGPRRIGRLLARYGSAHEAVRRGASDPEMPEAARAWLKAPERAAVAASLAWGEQPGAHILPLTDPRYPPLLRDIADPPPVLFLQGAPEALCGPLLAIVGSRNPTAGGRETAEAFARHLAGVGISVVSGLALGIDAAAHRGALAGGGTTVAVFGTGPDRIYPARNKALAHDIVSTGGALVSEFPPGTPSKAEHFPRRNRIISGLSLGTVVVEAALKSGSLITARTAVEQGREVFAVPGSIHNPLARGCHRLIRDGAKLVETATDILEELAPQLHEFVRPEPAPDPDAAAQEPAAATLEPAHRELLDHLDHGPAPVDLLVQRSGLTAQAVSSMLLLLELEGYLTSTPAGYTRTSKRA